MSIAVARLGYIAALVSAALLAIPAGASASAPSWFAHATGNTVTPAGGSLTYGLQIVNVGDASAHSEDAPPASTAVTAVVALPPGITASGAGSFGASGWSCTGDGPGSAPGIVGAGELVCMVDGTVNVAPNDEEHGERIGLLAVEAEIGALPEGATPTARFDVYAPAGSLLPDGSPCAAAAPGIPCATAVKPVRVSAAPEFGASAFDFSLGRDDGSPDTRAAGLPHLSTTWIDLEKATNENIDPPETVGEDQAWPVQSARDVVVDLPSGFLGNAALMPTCSLAQLTATTDAGGIDSACPVGSQVGGIRLAFSGLAGDPVDTLVGPPGSVFNMEPPPGTLARFSFLVLGVVISIDFRLRSEPDYGLRATVANVSQAVPLTGSRLTVWGDPAADAHTPQRLCPDAPGHVVYGCASSERSIPFLRNPTSCQEPDRGMPVGLHLDSWDNRASIENGAPDLTDPNWKSVAIETHDLPGYPELPEQWGDPRGIEECEVVPVQAQISTRPTSRDAATPTGLKVRVEVPNPGIENADGLASSDIRKVRVALPEGVTINPAQGAGLGVCTPARYASTEGGFNPDPATGCPADSKIGTVTVRTPVLDETLSGSVYVAEPYKNPFGTLIALYIVISNPERGILIKLPGKVEPDRKTAQVIATFDDLPQLPFASFDLDFRSGVRSPLATPRRCGTFTTEAQFTPWSDADRTINRTSSFEIVRGIGGGACPQGVPSFEPGLLAGATNNNAASHSPFTLRITRGDAEQEITSFSADLPPGLAATLAGIPKCSDAALIATAAASALDSIHRPVCPVASQVGRITSGFGVGAATYATGRVFLAGPYRGTPLSIATVVPALVGPFDLGTVVVRSAFRIDPEDAQAHVDSTASDPIPHIREGIELHLRDLRLYMDRPGFMLNPTNCDPMSIDALLTGSGADFATPADDVPFSTSNPFQAANCSLLPFKPKLSFRLKGGTKRGAFPALRANLKARPGDANLGKAVVTLPPSAFLEQAHIGTVCTRVQFAANACPPASVYGFATASTPLLDEPLRGPAYLRSSNNLLPDLVIALRGEISVDAVGRIDSINGGIRTTFDTIPDTPLDSFHLRMQGGKKGLFVNSRNLCKAPARARVRFVGQNGKALNLRPKMQVRCSKAKRGKPKRGPRSRGRG